MNNQIHDRELFCATLWVKQAKKECQHTNLARQFLAKIPTTTPNTGYCGCELCRGAGFNCQKYNLECDTIQLYRKCHCEE